MKTFIIIFLTLFSLQADELKRIESIINDIAKLRVENEECQSALESKGILKVQTIKENDCTNYEKNIKTLKVKNTLLEKKLQEQTKILNNTKNKIETYKKEAKIKENKIKTLKNQLTLLEKNNKSEPKVVIKEVVKEVVKDKYIYPKDDNVFPTLMPKNPNNKREDFKEKEVAQETRPTTYRLKNDSKIYSKLDGDEIYIWEKDKSFTSNIKTQNYVKITGYFVDRKWQKAEEELWINKVDIFER